MFKFFHSDLGNLKNTRSLSAILSSNDIDCSIKISIQIRYKNQSASLLHYHHSTEYFTNIYRREGLKKLQDKNRLLTAVIQQLVVLILLNSWWIDTVNLSTSYTITTYSQREVHSSLAPTLLWSWTLNSVMPFSLYK